MPSPHEDANLALAYLESKRAPGQRPVPPVPALPFEPLPALDAETRRRARVVALQANERYVQSFLEEHSICPFSRGGRLQGQTACVVHFVESSDVQPFLDRMAEAAAQPARAVVQIVLPMISVGAEDFRAFCHAITAAGNARLPGGETYAVAPLHPELPYLTRNAYSIIPLFRRAPDPTIQWVRLDALEALYEGRSQKDKYVHPSEIAAFLKKPHRKPLFDQIAETNLKMAQRLGLENIERTLRDIRLRAQEGYRTVLLGGEPPAVPARHEGPDAVAGATRVHRPPASPVREEASRAALALVRDLPLLSPVRYRVDGVDLVVVRTKDDVHVLHGRCPHRAAPLDTALVEGQHLVCSYHGWDFRLADGRSDGVPGERVPRLTAQVDGGYVWVDREQVRRVGGDVGDAFSDVVL